MSSGIGILLVNTGMPDDNTGESARSYVEDVFAGESYESGLGFVESQIFKRMVIPLKAREWKGYLANQANRVQYLESQSALVRKLKERLVQVPRIRAVAMGTLHGTPSLDEGLRHLKDADCSEVLIVPLCPFSFRPFIDMVRHRVEAALVQNAEDGWDPKTRHMGPFCDDRRFVQGAIKRIEEDWNPKNNSRLLVLMPSIPRQLSLEDATYEKQIVTFRERLENKLSLSPSQIHVAYLCDRDNSRWLGPFAEKTLMGWAGGAVRDVRAICPAFPFADPMGSYEAGIRIKSFFQSNAIGLPVEYGLVKPLGQDDSFAESLAHTIARTV